MNLHERAMIVRVSISQWTARRYDKKVSDKVEKDYGSKDSGRWNKILISREAIQEIQSLCGEARQYIYRKTWAWGDNGDRVLPNHSFSEVDAELKNYKRKFDERVEKFCMNYPALIEEAKERLNGMFSKDDYPDPSRIQERFDFRIGYFPIPQAGDFRVSLDISEAEKIKAAIKEENDRLLQIANRELWERIFKNVSHMAERLADVKAIFRDSLVENIKELCDELDKLNIMQDKDLKEMVDRIRTHLSGEDPDELRNNRKLRKEIAKEANDILIEIETKRKLIL